MTSPAFGAPTPFSPPGFGAAAPAPFTPPGFAPQPAAAAFSPPGMAGAGATGQRVSLHEFSEGSLVNEANLLILASRFDYYNFPNGAGSTTALILNMQDDMLKEYEQVYSVGKVDEWAPTNDKTGLIAQGAKTKINDGTNYAHLIKSLIAAGFPEAAMGDDIRWMNGIYGFYRRVVIQRDFGNDPTRAPRNNNRPDPGTLVMSVLFNRGDQQLIRGTPAMAGFTPPPAGATVPPATQAAATAPAAVAPPPAFAPAPVTPPTAPATPAGVPANMPAFAPVPAPAPTTAPAGLIPFNVPADVSQPVDANAMSMQLANWLITFVQQTPNKQMTAQQIGQHAFTAFEQHPYRNAIVTQAYEDGFLAHYIAQSGVAAYDPNTHTMSKA